MRASRLLPPLLLCLSLLTFACGDNTSLPSDASTADASDLDASTDPDGGEAPDANPATLCTKLCIVIDLCFGEGGPECESQCAAALAGCNGDELEQLEDCAAESCDQFEECLFSVECLGGGPGEFCGDGTCDPGETCAFCPDDCGACVCGDDTCSPGECATCEEDCPGGCVCPHDTCTTGDLLDPGCDPCVGEVCAVDPYCCEIGWDAICVGEAESICGKDCPAFCGDFTCDPGEEETCPEDCGVEPGFCGDKTCDAWEDCGTCAADCGACVCGDGTCNLGECATCESDCPGGCVCPHDPCVPGDSLDPGCDPCVADICEAEPFCCTDVWHPWCVHLAEEICDKDCPAVCGDTVCDPGEEGVCEDCFVDGVDAGVPAPDAAP